MFLETIHGPYRVAAIYFSGGLTGALMTSVTDPGTFLAGASGGVYALMIAHAPTVILNWREMKTFVEWMVWSDIFFVLFVTSFPSSVFITYLRLQCLGAGCGFVRRWLYRLSPVH